MKRPRLALSSARAQSNSLSDQGSTHLWCLNVKVKNGDVACASMNNVDRCVVIDMPWAGQSFARTFFWPQGYRRHQCQRLRETRIELRATILAMAPIIWPAKANFHPANVGSLLGIIGALNLVGRVSEMLRDSPRAVLYLWTVAKEGNL